MENKKILYLYTGNHPVHRKFAESVGADKAKMGWKISQNYDIYLIEAGYLKPAILKMLRILGNEKLLITIFADPRLYYIKKRKYFNERKKQVCSYPLLKLIIYKYLLKKIDGGLCVGEMMGDTLREVSPQTPKRIVHSFLDKEILEKIDKIKFKKIRDKILFIGNGPDYYYKGLDLLIKSFKEIKLKFPKLKLKIVGNWEIMDWWVDDRIIFTGKVIDISKEMADSFLMVHLGRGDTFPTTTLESMYAKIPVIVSEDTGTKKIISMIREKNIVGLKKQEVIKAIEENILLEKNHSYGLKFRKAVMKYKELDILVEFQRKFEELLKEIYEKK